MSKVQKPSSKSSSQSNGLPSDNRRALGGWSFRTNIRRALAGVALTVAILSEPDLFLQVYRWWFEVDADISRTIEWDQAVTEIVAPRLGTSETLLSAAIGLIAGSWVLLLLQKDANEKILSSWIERTTLLASSVGLAFSCMSHIRYTDELIATQLKAIGESKLLLYPLDPLVNVYFTAQVFGIVCGALCIGLAAMSALWIKDER